MGIFLYKAAVALLLVQAPHPDSVRAGLWARVAADSTDGTAWLDLGRSYLQQAADYHTHRKPVTVDTVWAHANLDTAQAAFDRAARWSAGARTADAARVVPVYALGGSMGFERPPDERAVRWNKRPLVWVTGKETKADRVPAQDFVFAALKLAVDEHETWTGPVSVLYRRAVTSVGGLCKAFDTFELGSEVGCH